MLQESAAQLEWELNSAHMPTCAALPMVLCLTPNLMPTPRPWPAQPPFPSYLFLNNSSLRVSRSSVSSLLHCNTESHLRTGWLQRGLAHKPQPQ